MRATVRESDTVSRYGGDEFVALLPGVDGLDQARMVVEKMLERVREPFTLDQQRVQVTLSCGIAIYPEDGRFTGSSIWGLEKNAPKYGYRIILSVLVKLSADQTDHPLRK